MSTSAGFVAVLGVCLSLGAVSACVSDDPIDPRAAVLQVSIDSCRPNVENRATAVAIGDGLALTVAHSFDDAKAIQLVGPSGTEISADLVFLDRGRDIAMLNFDDAAFGPEAQRGLELRSDAADPVSNARVVLHRAGGSTVAPVTILRRATVTLDGDGSREGIEIEAEIERGDSGAPLVDEDDRVIGMVFATSRTGETGWTIAASELIDVADQIGDPIELACP